MYGLIGRINFFSLIKKKIIKKFVDNFFLIITKISISHNKVKQTPLIDIAQNIAVF